MKKKFCGNYWYFILIILIQLAGCTSNDSVDSVLKYGTGSWEPDTLGNHRVVLQVNSEENAVKAEINWRRRDFNPDKKLMILIDGNTGHQVMNMLTIEINRESGKIIFEPVSGKGEYYLYYLPYKMTGRNYPTVNYPEPIYRSDSTWINRNRLANMGVSSDRWMEIPDAEIIEFQSIDEFNSFYPMEVIATQAETEELISHIPDSGYLLFPESRKYPIRMTKDLPYRWINKGITHSFEGEALINEYFAFQIGFFAAKTSIDDINIIFTDLSDRSGKRVIPSKSFTCFNKEGINWNGQSFTKEIAIEEGTIQPLWFGIDIPDDASPGKYSGVITIHPSNHPEQSIELELNIRNEVLDDRGDGEPWRHSRLRWLNSQIAADNDIVEPFTPLVLDSNSVSCLGRTIILNQLGLPDKYLTYFNSEVTQIEKESREVVSYPVKLTAIDKKGVPGKWLPGDFRFIQTDPGLVSWQSTSRSGDLKMECNGKMEFDGYLGFNIIITAQEETDLTNIQLKIPINREFATYFMGLGLKGGKRSGDHQWKWDWQKNQEGAWIGNVNGGLQFGLRGKNYARPLNTNFYLSKPQYAGILVQ